MRIYLAIALAAALACGCTVEKEPGGDTDIKVSRDAKEAGERIVEGARDVGEKGAQISRQASTTAKVSSTLRAAAVLDIEDLNVDTVDNIITIEGKVPNLEQKEIAQRLAEYMAGPEYTVQNRLELKS